MNKQEIGHIARYIIGANDGIIKLCLKHTEVPSFGTVSAIKNAAPVISNSINVTCVGFLAFVQTYS